MRLSTLLFDLATKKKKVKTILYTHKTIKYCKIQLFLLMLERKPFLGTKLLYELGYSLTHLVFSISHSRRSNKNVLF